MVIRSLFVMLTFFFLLASTLHTSINEAVVVSYKELPQNTMDLSTFQMIVLITSPWDHCSFVFSGT